MLVDGEQAAKRPVIDIRVKTLVRRWLFFIVPPGKKDPCNSEYYGFQRPRQVILIQSIELV